MLVSASHQVTTRKFSQREANQPRPDMFTRAQAAAVAAPAAKPAITASVSSTATAAVTSKSSCTSAGEVVPSVSVTITSVGESGVLPCTSASTPVLDTPTITNLVLNSLEGVHSGVPTRTTPTLTPTTLRNIEQTFLELSTLPPPETHTNQAGFVPPLVHPTPGNTFVSVDSKCWGGGSLTQVHTSTTSSSPALLLRTSPPITTTSPTPTSTMPSTLHPPQRRTGGRRPIKDEKLSAEEEERRSMRRERNKLAAARCRKRRLDQTNMLQDETDELEDRKSELQNEIQLLQQQRDELEFLLATHKAVCRRRLSATPPPPPPPPHSPPHHVRVKPVVKVERDEEEVGNLGAGASKARPRRPTSLNVAPVALRTPSVTDLGVPIETPSAGLRGLNFESMMEGGTGLTPVSAGAGLTPLHSGLTPLTTPVVSAPAGSASGNCSTQQRSSSSDLSSPDSIPPKLVSL